MYNLTEAKEYSVLTRSCATHARHWYVNASTHIGGSRWQCRNGCICQQDDVCSHAVDPSVLKAHNRLPFLHAMVAVADRQPLSQASHVIAVVAVRWAAPTSCMQIFEMLRP